MSFYFLDILDEETLQLINIYLIHNFVVIFIIDSNPSKSFEMYFGKSSQASAASAIDEVGF